MKATITDKSGFTCAPDGHTVVTFECGDVVTGKVAKWAVDAGAANRDGIEAGKSPQLETKVVTTPETKRRKGRGK